MRTVMFFGSAARRPGLPVLRVLIFLAGLMVLPQIAAAHAVLQASMPANNATLDATRLGGDVPVLLNFNSRIDAAHSSLSLVQPDGKSVALTIEKKADANLLRSHATGLRAGSYSLRWQVVAGDGHITRGAIAFRVR